MGTHLRGTADDSSAFPVSVRLGRSERRTTRALPAATDALSALCGDDGGIRSASSCDALVSRDMFDRKQQNRSKCCPKIVRDAATIGSVPIHTQATRHTHDRIDRRKVVKECSPNQGRYKNSTTLHLATMSRGKQEDEGPTTKGS